MRRRTLATLVVASMLLLAGCSFGGGGGDQSLETDAPATSTEETGTATPASTGGDGGSATFSYPSGYNEEGVVNASAAVESHRAGLLDTSGYALTYDATVSTPNTTTYVQYDQQVETESREVVRRTNVTSGDVQGLVVRYYADDTVYVKSNTPGSNETSYANQSRSYDLGLFTGIEFLRPALEDVSFASSERTTRDGTSVVVYRDATLGNATQVFGENVRLSNVSDFEATLVVDADGVVRELRYAATVATRGTDRRVEIVVAVDGVGSTTVDEPDWLSQA